MIARELMTKGVDHVNLDCTATEAARKMKRKNIGALAVCDQDELVGVVTDRDIVTSVVAVDRDPAKILVAEIMSADVATCRDGDAIQTVARLMETRKVRRVLVLDQRGKMVGMLSLDDFGRRMAGRDLVGEVLEAVAARHA